MPQTPCKTVDLRDVAARAQNARHMLTGICLAMPALDGLCRHVRDSLADVPPMAAEIGCLRRDLARTRLCRANLAAAGRAAFAAQQQGEADPLSYLRDELAAQGYADPQGAA